MSKTSARTSQGQRFRSCLEGVALFVALAGPGCGEVPRDEHGEALVETSKAVYFGGHEYHFFLTPQPFDGANETCFDDHMHLVTINSASEAAFLTSTEQNLYGGGVWWIGYNDRQQEGSWKWVDGTPNGYVNWLAGQPDNSNDEDCAADNWDGSGKWNDWNCDHGSAKFICEKNSLPTGTSGGFSFSATNTNNAQQNYASWAVDLAPTNWVPLTVGTCDMPGASYTGDTYLRIFNPSGVEVAANDDACGSPKLGSNLSISSGQIGTWVIHAGCYSSGSCSANVKFTGWLAQ